MLHLIPMRGPDPFNTTVQESTELFAGHEELVQLVCKDTPRKIDPFHFDVLSDHFQPALEVELILFPPTQQPLLTSTHRF